MNTRLQHHIEDPAARLALARQALRRGDQETIDRLCGEDAAVARWAVLTDRMVGANPKWHILAHDVDKLEIDGVAFPAWTAGAARCFLADVLEHAALEHEECVQSMASEIADTLRADLGGDPFDGPLLPAIANAIGAKERALTLAVRQAWLSQYNVVRVIAYTRSAVKDREAEAAWQRACLRGYLLGEVGA